MLINIPEGPGGNMEGEKRAAGKTFVVFGAGSLPVTGETPTPPPMAFGGEDITVSVLESDGTANLKKVSLGSHCVLCLRSTGSQKRKDPLPKKLRKESTVPEGRLPKRKGLTLLRTLNWVWGSMRGRLRNKDKYCFDLPGIGLEIVGFRDVPKMCHDCLEALVGMDKQLNQIRKEIGQLKNQIARWNEDGRCYTEFYGKLHKSGVDKQVVDDTLEFFKEFRSTLLTLENEDETEMECEPSPVIKTDPLADIATDEYNCGISGSTSQLFFGGDELDDNSSPMDGDEIKLKKDEDELSVPEDETKVDINYASQSTTSGKGNNGEQEVKPKQLRSRVKIACQVCTKVVRQKEFEAHMRSHTGRQINCDLCDIKLQRTEMLEHLKGHVGTEYVTRCKNPECSFFCVNPKRLLNHLRHAPLCRKKIEEEIHPEYRKSVCTCAECGVEHLSLAKLGHHLFQHHETAKKNFPCPVSGCQMQFSVKQSVVLHLDKHDVPKESDTQTCVKCEGKPVPVEEMEAHLKEEHGVDEVINCRKCDFRFSSWEELVDHMFAHRFGELLCDICGDAGGKFNRHAELLKHYFKVHKIGKQYQCEHCPKSFYKVIALTAHVDIHHKKVNRNNKPKQSYQCEHCGTVCGQESTLRKHKIINHGAEPYACKFCKDTFVSHDLLREHEAVVHRGVTKSFVCGEPNCGEKFPNESGLRQHCSTVHGNNGDFVCDQCGKAFWKAYKLRQHKEIVHLGMKKWVCDTCGESFTSGTTMRRHNLIHTGERPFACDICGQRFRQNVALQRHLVGHQEKGVDFKPNGPMKGIRKRIRTN